MLSAYHVWLLAYLAPGAIAFIGFAVVVISRNPALPRDPVKATKHWTIGVADLIMVVKYAAFAYFFVLFWPVALVVLYRATRQNQDPRQQ